MKATEAAPPTGRSSDNPPTPTSVRSFGLTGPSALPDPARHAYRRDLADVALAGRVVASHFVEPLKRSIAAPAMLRSAASEDAPEVRQIAGGEPFWLLDESRGWAWGYAGAERDVGYVRSEALA